MRSPEPNREVFRLAPPVILWWVWVAFVIVNVADFAIQGASARFAIVVSAILVAITGLVYALALRPRVIAEPSGLTIVNPFRDHHVPWAAITAVDTGEWVRVHYAPGQAAPAAASPPSSATSKAISCWALYISARTKRRAARAGPRHQSACLDSPGPPRGGRGEARPFRACSPPPTRSLATRGCPRRRGTSPRCRRPRPSPSAWTPARTANAPASSRPPRDKLIRGSRSEHPVTARWPWPPIAAVVLPALALLIVVLA